MRSENKFIVSVECVFCVLENKLLCSKTAWCSLIIWYTNLFMVFNINLHNFLMITWWEWLEFRIFIQKKIFLSWEFGHIHLFTGQYTVGIQMDAKLKWSSSMWKHQTNGLTIIPMNLKSSLFIIHLLWITINFGYFFSILRIIFAFVFVLTQKKNKHFEWILMNIFVVKTLGSARFPCEMKFTIDHNWYEWYWMKMKFSSFFLFCVNVELFILVILCP